MKFTRKFVPTVSTALLLLGATFMSAPQIYAQKADIIPLDNISIPVKYVSPAINPFRLSTHFPTPPADAKARQNYTEAKVMRLKGVALFVQGKTQAAIDTLTQARDLWSDSAEVYHWLAEAYAVNGQPDKAINNYRLLFYGWPGRSSRTLAGADATDSPSDKASDYNLVQAEEVDPRLWLQFSLLLQQGNQWKEALTAYNKGREYLATHPLINPGPLPPAFDATSASAIELEAATHTGLAMAEESRMAHEDAANELDLAIGLQPDAAVAYFYKGELLKGQSDRSTEALAAFVNASKYGGSPMQPFLQKAYQTAPPEFAAAAKNVGLLSP